jgi:hypothetical protein
MGSADAVMRSADGVVTPAVEAALVPDGQIQARAMATDVHSAIALRRWKRMSGAIRVNGRERRRRWGETLKMGLIRVRATA